jgi:aerobic carbon-monoxide dehydrogenase large subunit
LLSGSFMDYGMPRADDMPDIDFENIPYPNPNNPLGVKGCGEAGTIGAMPSIMNAISDALGGAVIDMPATPEKVWRILNAQKILMAAE